MVILVNDNARPTSRDIPTLSPFSHRPKQRRQDVRINIKFTGSIVSSANRIASRRYTSRLASSIPPGKMQVAVPNTPPRLRVFPCVFAAFSGIYSDANATLGNEAWCSRGCRNTGSPPPATVLTIRAIIPNARSMLLILN